MKILLASSSPRRFELLKSLGHDVRVIASSVEEITEGCPKSIAITNARLKAEKVFFDHDLLGEELIVAADTVVFMGPENFGKPHSPKDAIAMLSILSGREHEVVTAFCIIKNNQERCESHVISKVSLRNLREEEIKAYVKTGECMDKAGSYAVNGLAAALIDQIHGSITNIMGLPIKELLYEADKLMQYNSKSPAAGQR